MKNDAHHPNSINRRRFIQQGSLLGAALAGGSAPAALRADLSSNDKVIIGVMGVSRSGNDNPGRGCTLAMDFAALPGVEVAYVCDVDERNVEKAIRDVSTRQTRRPKGVRDFRRILDDPSVDALVMACPVHWHGPATIMACAAGKHVYVEKPACHNPQEGEWMVAAARKHKRVVQLGTQRRSMPALIEAVHRVRSGEIGPVHFARAWMASNRPAIGRGQPASVPGWLDYSLWQGPAPEQEYRDNVVHYNWHWFWHWGTGELGNHGIHTLDVCRWGLGVETPRLVSALGGRYFHQDDQETPDTLIATFDFGDKCITWENRSCQSRGLENRNIGLAFHGENGTLVIGGGDYKIYDLKDKEVGAGSGHGGHTLHLRNFIECIRSGQKLNAEIGEGVKSTLLCHLGNMAYRTGQTLHLDPVTHKITNSKEASALWGREYRPGWMPKV